MRTEKHCYAWHTDGFDDWTVDLYHYGVREGWDDGAVWDVAAREMHNLWGKPVTAWCFLLPADARQRLAR